MLPCRVRPGCVLFSTPACPWAENRGSDGRARPARTLWHTLAVLCSLAQRVPLALPGRGGGFLHGAAPAGGAAQMLRWRGHSKSEGVHPPPKPSGWVGGGSRSDILPRQRQIIGFRLVLCGGAGETADRGCKGGGQEKGISVCAFVSSVCLCFYCLAAILPPTLHLSLSILPRVLLPCTRARSLPTLPPSLPAASPVCDRILKIWAAVLSFRRSTQRRHRNWLVN